MIIPIILAGGTGSRLWPLSREHFPKQLLTLVGEDSLLQETIKRTQHLPGVTDPVIICNRQYRFIVAEQMLEMGIETPHLILEPSGRNTAPAIAMAALLTQQLYPGKNPLLLILPADHIIAEHDLFIAGILQSASFAEEHLITFGIRPAYSETGYGYIHAGKIVDKQICKVIEFIEKPDKTAAEAYIKNGSYFWNSGMFLFSAVQFLTELALFRKDIYEFCKQEAASLNSAGGFFALSQNFSSCPSESIDYAVMEKTDKALMFPLNVNWSDVGSWTALHDVLPRDAEGNILHGDVTCLDTENSMIRAEHRLVAAVGLKNMIVIETADAVMVAHKDYAQKVKDLVAQLKIQQRKELT